MADVSKEFASPRSKMKRARTHIQSFSEAIEGHLGGVTAERVIEPIGPQHRGLYRRRVLIYESDCLRSGVTPTDPPHEPAYVHKLQIFAPPAEDLNTIASDAVQNMRQALDHAVCACARLTGKTDNGTYFPLIDAGGDIEVAIKDKARKAPPSIKDIIRKSEPGGGLLFELHKLGVKDKHALLCNAATLDAAAQLQFMQAASDSWVVAGFFEDEWDADRSELRYALTGTPTEMNYQFRFHIQVRFDAAGAIATKPALAALNEIADTVDGIIGEMADEMSRLTS